MKNYFHFQERSQWNKFFRLALCGFCGALIPGLLFRLASQVAPGLIFSFPFAIRFWFLLRTGLMIVVATILILLWKRKYSLRGSKWGAPVGGLLGYWGMSWLIKTFPDLLFPLSFELTELSGQFFFWWYLFLNCCGIGIGTAFGFLYMARVFKED